MIYLHNKVGLPLVIVEDVSWSGREPLHKEEQVPLEVVGFNIKRKLRIDFDLSARLKSMIAIECYSIGKSQRTSSSSVSASLHRTTISNHCAGMLYCLRRAERRTELDRTPVRRSPSEAHKGTCLEGKTDGHSSISLTFSKVLANNPVMIIRFRTTACQD